MVIIIDPIHSTVCQVFQLEECETNTAFSVKSSSLQTQFLTQSLVLVSDSIWLCPPLTFDSVGLSLERIDLSDLCYVDPQVSHVFLVPL